MHQQHDIAACPVSDSEVIPVWTEVSVYWFSSFECRFAGKIGLRQGLYYILCSHFATIVYKTICFLPLVLISFASETKSKFLFYDSI